MVHVWRDHPPIVFLSLVFLVLYCCGINSPGGGGSESSVECVRDAGSTTGCTSCAEGHCNGILCEVSEVKWSGVADVECSVVYIVV